MSLESKIGIIMMTVAGLYLIVVPLIKWQLPAILPAIAFLLVGGVGLWLFYSGLKKPETKSP